MSPQEILSYDLFGFTLKVIINAAAGAVLLWGLESDTNVERYSFGRLTSKIPNEILRILTQGFVFVAFGTYLALLLVRPDTGRQAFAAGIGWTAGVNGVSRRAYRTSTKEKEKQRRKDREPNAAGSGKP